MEKESFEVQHSKLLSWAYIEAINKDYAKARRIIEVAIRLKERNKKIKWW